MVSGEQTCIYIKIIIVAKNCSVLFFHQSLQKIFKKKEKVFTLKCIVMITRELPFDQYLELVH